MLDHLDLFELIGLRLSARWWVVVGCFGEAFFAWGTFVAIIKVSKLFPHLWGNWPCTTRIAYPLLPIWSPWICRVWFHLNSTITPSLSASIDLNLIGIGRIGLDFIRIRRICFHFIWIWGWLWDASSWACPLPLFGSRLLHSDVICHPGCLWLYISTLIFNTLILIFLWINHLSRVSSPVSWSMMSTQSFGGAGSVFPWRQQTQVRI